MPSEILPPADEAEPSFRRNQSWVKRFGVACRGVKIAARAEASFFVHLFVTAMVLLSGAILDISRWEWCLMVLCIATVLCAELLNTSLERMARAVTREEDSHVRDALDIASGAVLVAAMGAAIVGVLVFGLRAAEMLSR